MEFLEFKNGKILQVHDIKTTCEQFAAEVATTVQYLQDQNNRLQEENKTLKNEHYKDTELLHMQADLEIMRNQLKRGFPLSEEESDTIFQWQYNHMQTKHKGQSSGAVGGRFTYCFTPTSIGTMGEIQCSCGAKYIFKELT
jgi:hypothetical protein